MKQYYKVTEQGKMYTNTTAKTAKGIVKAFSDFYEFDEETTINGITYFGEYRGSELPLEVRIQVLILEGMIEQI